MLFVANPPISLSHFIPDFTAKTGNLVHCYRFIISTVKNKEEKPTVQMLLMPDKSWCKNPRDVIAHPIGQQAKLSHYFKNKEMRDNCVWIIFVSGVRVFGRKNRWIH